MLYLITFVITWIMVLLQKEHKDQSRTKGRIFMGKGGGGKQGFQAKPNSLSKGGVDEIRK